MRDQERALMSRSKSMMEKYKQQSWGTYDTGRERMEKQVI